MPSFDLDCSVSLIVNSRYMYVGGKKKVYAKGREGRQSVCQHVIELSSELSWLKCGRLNTRLHACFCLICSKEAFGLGLDLGENLNLKRTHLSLEKDMGPAFPANL